MSDFDFWLVRWLNVEVAIQVFKVIIFGAKMLLSNFGIFFSSVLLLIALLLIY